MKDPGRGRFPYHAPGCSDPPGKPGTSAGDIQEAGDGHRCHRLSQRRNSTSITSIADFDMAGMENHSSSTVLKNDCPPSKKIPSCAHQAN